MHIKTVTFKWITCWNIINFFDNIRFHLSNHCIKYARIQVFTDSYSPILCAVNVSLKLTFSRISWDNFCVVNYTLFETHRINFYLKERHHWKGTFFTPLMPLSLLLFTRWSQDIFLSFLRSALEIEAGQGYGKISHWHQLGTHSIL